MTNAPQRDIFRLLAAIALVGALLWLTFWILRPFLPAIVWAAMIVISTWPLLLMAQRRLWGRRPLAAALMTLTLLLVFVVPFSLAVGTIVTHVDQILGWIRSLGTLQLGEPPAWLQNLPLAGEKLAALWREVAQSGNLGSRIAPYLGDVVNWFVSQVGSMGALFAQFLLTVVVAAILYARGEAVAETARRFAVRVGGERGESAVRLAAQAIRSVALGIVVTAIAQAVLGGLGLAVAGVPFAPVLTAIMFILAVAQIGVVPVLVGGIVWLFWKDQPGWATALIVWTVLVATLDNVLRPMLIRRGANLPLVLIFAGVIGGMVAFGLIGLFIGPTVLAVTHTLFTAWVSAPAEQPDASPATAERPR